MTRVVFALAALVFLAGHAFADPTNEKVHDHGTEKVAHDAHAGHKAMVTASIPADGATVAPPEALILTFAHPMALQTVALTGPDGKTSAVPGAKGAAAARVSVPLPALRPGAWRAAWKAVGTDGHTMTGIVRFTVR